MIEEISSPVEETSPLQKWNIPFSDFGILVALMLSAMVVFASIAHTIAAEIIGKPAEGEELPLLITLWDNFGMQLGFLFSFLAFHKISKKSAPVDNPQPKLKSVKIGLKWLLISYPAMIVIALGWKSMLEMLGYEQTMQEPVKMIQEGGTLFEQIFLYSTVVLVAPICEELSFRGIIFRFLFVRTPLFLSLGISATIFALIHLNLFSFAPLLAIGVGLALAYRESGSILSSIVFHAAFNGIQLIMILFFLEP